MVELIKKSKKAILLVNGKILEQYTFTLEKRLWTIRGYGKVFYVGDWQGILDYVTQIWGKPL